MTNKHLIEKGSAATRQLAKRQLTWLRSFPIKHVLDPYSESTRPEILRLVKNSYQLNQESRERFAATQASRSPSCKWTVRALIDFDEFGTA